MVLDVKSKLRGVPQRRTSTLPVSSAPTGHAGVRQVGQRHQQALQLGLQRVQPLGAGLQFVGDAVHLGHQRRRRPRPCPWPGRSAWTGCCAAPAVLGAGLDALALGFQRAEARDVEEGLRASCALRAARSRRQVAAQQVDVEHGGFLRGCGNWAAAAAAGRPGRVWGGVDAAAPRQDRTRGLGHADLSPRPRGSGKCTCPARRPSCARWCTQFAQARDHLLHQDVGRRGAGRQAHARAGPRTRRLQVVGARRPCRPACPAARPVRAGGCCCCWWGCRPR
jgi:hypothetical protein